MQNVLRTTVLTVALLVAPFAYAAAPAATPLGETYTLDPSHTAVTWTISHFDFSHPWGKFSMITGSLMLDEKNPEKSTLAVTIPINNLNTGIDKLDEHLKTDQFFDVAHYPIATFASTKIERTGKNTAKVTGDLTLHGVTKPVMLDVTLNKIGDNMMKVKTAGFSATATIKRSDFGMTQYLPMLGDEVKLYIESEANLQSASPAPMAPTKH